MGRAIGIDAEPYRGRLVPDRGPRVGIVNHARGHGHRPRHIVRDSLVERRHSMIDGDRLTDMGKPGTAEWKRATASHDYRRGFTAGIVVTASASSVLMLVGFLGMGGLDALGRRLDGEQRSTASEGYPGAARDEGGERYGQRPSAAELMAGAADPSAPADITGPTHAPTARPEESDEERLLREEGELANEELGERDYGLQELVRTQQHNRKVLKRGNGFIQKLMGDDE